jgi:hypothetical protein
MSEKYQRQGKSPKVWAVIPAASILGGLNVLLAPGIDTVRDALAGMVGGAYLGLLYFITRTPASSQKTKVITLIAGLTCGAACAALLGRGIVEILVWAAAAAGVGFLSNKWLPHI